MELPASLRRGIVRVLKRRQLNEIADAGMDLNTVDIDYVNAQGELIQRTIRPYETKPHRTSGTLMVYATDTLHGAGNIHSFVASRILRTERTEKSYHPRWPVEYYK